MLTKLKSGELCTPNCYGCCGDNELDFAYCPDVADNFEKELANLGYLKIGEDEIVIKKRQYEQLKKYNRDRKRLRLKWQQTKQEKRDILQAINKYLVGTRGIYTIKTFRNCRFEDLMLVRADDLETLVKKLAKEHGVELED